MRGRGTIAVSRLLVAGLVLAVLAGGVSSCSQSSTAKEPGTTTPGPVFHPPPGPDPSGLTADVLVALARRAFDLSGARDALGSAAAAMFLQQIEGAIRSSPPLVKAPGPASARLAAVAPPSDCTGSPAPFEKDGYRGEATIASCEDRDPDRRSLKYSVKGSMAGVTPETQGKTAAFEQTILAEADACPSAEGKVKAEAAATMYMQTGTPEFSLRAGFNAAMAGTATVSSQASVDTYEFSATIGAEWARYPAQLKGEARVAGTIPIGSGASVQYSQVDWVGPNDESGTNIAGDGLATVMNGVHRQLVRAEEYWSDDAYPSNGRCLRITLQPEKPQVKPLETVELEVAVRRKKDEAEVEARVEGDSLCQGDMSPATADASPGASARMAYTAPAGAPCFELKATSRAGKARLSWHGIFIERLTADEENEMLTLEGGFGEDPGPALRSVTIGGMAAEVVRWWGPTVQCRLPPGWKGDVVVEADGVKSNAVPLTEWVVPIIFIDRTDMFGSYQATVSATCRFRGDVHWTLLSGPLAVPPVAFPVYPENTSTASYSMSQQFQIGDLVGQASGAGTLAQVVRVGPTGVEPAAPSYLMCEGELDPILSKLRLSLRAFQKDGVQGTSNLGASTSDFLALDSTIGQTQDSALVRGMVFTLPLSTGYDIPAGRLTGQGTWEATNASGGTDRGTIDQALEWPAVQASPPLR